MLDFAFLPLFADGFTEENSTKLCEPNLQVHIRNWGSIHVDIEDPKTVYFGCFLTTWLLNRIYFGKQTNCTHIGNGFVTTKGPIHITNFTSQTATDRTFISTSDPQSLHSILLLAFTHGGHQRNSAKLCDMYESETDLQMHAHSLRSPL